MRVGIVGSGAVGARCARQLLSTEDVHQVVLRDENSEHLRALSESLGEGATVDRGAFTDPLDVDVVVLAGPAGVHAAHAQVFVGRGQPVVSTSDDIADVRALLDLDSEATERAISVVVGAGFAPGLTCVLATHAASRFEIGRAHV